MTTPRDDLQLRPAADDEYETVTRLVARAFGQEWRPDEDGAGAGVFEPARSLVFTDAGQIVANASAYSRTVTVPGAVVPGAHVTLVGVHPTYRRRGLLTRLIHRQLREVREGGVEPIALLWASEGRIYQRFGYGVAAHRISITADRRDVRLLPRLAGGAAGGGRLREAVPGQVRKELMEVYERVRQDRVGWSSRNEYWWNFVLTDRPDDRDGATARHALLYEDDDGVQGYALWRTRPKWSDDGPAGQANVREVVAATPEAYTALWRFLFSVDLTRTVDFWCGSPDEPIMHMLDEPRVLGGRMLDSLYVRIADLPAALCARRYTTPLDVVLEVDDALLPENAGRWRLTASGDSVTCVPTDEPADLTCDVADLGAAYLGGPSLATLAAAGRVRERRPGTLAAASTAFGWHRPPSATEIF